MAQLGLRVSRVQTARLGLRAILARQVRKVFLVLTAQRAPRVHKDCKASQE
jgi:hypothetical protein